MTELFYTVAVKGVDYTLEGNGGPECVNFIPLWQRLFETSIFVPLGVYCISLAWDYLEWPEEEEKEENNNNNNIDNNSKLLTPPSATTASTEQRQPQISYSNGKILLDNNGNAAAASSMTPIAAEASASVASDEPSTSTSKAKMLLLSDESPPPPSSNILISMISPFQEQLDDLRIWILGIYFLIFAFELVYKIMTRTGIFLANPCHQTTMLQLILLSLGKDNPRVTQIFRFQMYVMPGAFFALAFPILNTRLLIGEVFIYFVQHVFILIIPFYLLCLGGHYRSETYHNLAWPMFSMSIIVLYHFVFLQTIGYITLVNLNCILCPAISDPLGNRFWRIAAFTHQCILVPILAKSYSYYGQLVASYLVAAHEEKGPIRKIEEQKKIE